MNSKLFKTSLLCALLVSGFIFSGCASIVSESEYPVRITSSPEGAKFKVKKSNGALVATGVTPTTLTLSASEGFFKGADYIVTYEGGTTVPISSSVDNWYIFGNFVFGGLIGWVIVDPATGAMWKLPKYVSGGVVLPPREPKRQQQKKKKAAK